MALAAVYLRIMCYFIVVRVAVALASRLVVKIAGILFVIVLFFIRLWPLYFKRKQNVRPCYLSQ